MCVKGNFKFSILAITRHPWSRNRKGLVVEMRIVILYRSSQEKVRKSNPICARASKYFLEFHQGFLLEKKAKIENQIESMLQRLKTDRWSCQASRRGQKRRKTTRRAQMSENKAKRQRSSKNQQEEDPGPREKRNRRRRKFWIWKNKRQDQNSLFSLINSSIYFF